MTQSRDGLRGEGMTPGRPASLRARATCSAASWVRLDGLGTRTGSNLILDVHETAQNSNTERPAETGPRAHRTAWAYFPPSRCPIPAFEDVSDLHDPRNYRRGSPRFRERLAMTMTTSPWSSQVRRNVSSMVDCSASRASNAPTDVRLRHADGQPTGSLGARAAWSTWRKSLAGVSVMPYLPLRPPSP